MIGDLAARWHDQADTLDEWGDERGAAILRRAATELDAAAREHDDEALTIAQASEESGYSRDHLRALVAAGEIPNAGRKGSPRIRRGALPVKPGARAS
jgi:hypothetical protein